VEGWSADGFYGPIGTRATCDADWGLERARDSSTFARQAQRGRSKSPRSRAVGSRRAAIAVGPDKPGAAPLTLVNSIETANA
jgi:hypothetical protein